MTRAESILVIIHPPVLPTGQPAQYPRRRPATFHNSFDRPPSGLSREALDRAVQRIEAAQLLGGEQLIGYLHDLYRRNCKAGTIRSAAVAICSFLRLLKARSVVRLEDIRRAHIGAFIEHEQDRGLKCLSLPWRPLPPKSEFLSLYKGRRWTTQCYRSERQLALRYSRSCRR
jgi:hypothetical protein